MGQQNNLKRICINNSPSARVRTETCHWCGSRPRRLFRYGRDLWPKVFCNLLCWLSFHGVPRSSFDYVEPEER